MIEDRASRTALGVAVIRALHREIDRPVVFDDPFAEPILDADGRARLAERRADPTAAIRLRAMVAMRARFAEETLAAAIARGTRQYVLLGAGLDTFALRTRTPDLHVFEVDHPATQAWKKRSLAAAGLAEPACLTFVAVDFERQDLATELAAAGFRFDRPAVFALLGVVPYVARAAARATLAVVASIDAESEVVFDYTEPFDAAPEPIRRSYAAMAARAAAAGEPWVSFHSPEEMAAELGALGFVEIEDLAGGALAERFLGTRDDGLAPTPLGHLVRAANRRTNRPSPPAPSLDGALEIRHCSRP